MARIANEVRAAILAKLGPPLVKVQKEKETTPKVGKVVGGIKKKSKK